MCLPKQHCHTPIIYTTRGKESDLETGPGQRHLLASLIPMLCGAHVDTLTVDRAPIREKNFVFGLNFSTKGHYDFEQIPNNFSFTFFKMRIIIPRSSSSMGLGESSESMYVDTTYSR